MANDRVPTLLALLAGAIGVALLVAVARADSSPTPATPASDAKPSGSRPSEPKPDGAATASPTPRNTSTANATTTKPSACPQVAGNAPWSRIAFPSCPGYAYHVTYAIPDDHPCRVTIDTDGAGRMVILHRYDAQQRWLSETVDDVIVRRCSYDGDHLAWCESIRTQGDDAGTATRTTATYDHDRLVTLAGPHATQALHYNDAGDIDTVTDVADGTDVTRLDHDGDHRIVAEQHGRDDTTRFTYDDHDRVATRGTETFTYDTHGRLRRVDDGSSTDTINYDAHDRVASIVSSYGTRRTFSYSCR